MFDDIRGDIRLKTYVSYILAACMVHNYPYYYINS